MDTFRFETVISANRVLTVRGVPFRAGERVEVIVVRLPQPRTNRERYSLRGKQFKYVAPFDSVAENDWNTLK